jgi:maleate isomerase
MEGIDSPFAEVPNVPPKNIFQFMKGIAAKHEDADGIYMLGSAWRTLDIIDPLEKDLGLPVVHAGPARCWETQLRLGMRYPIIRYGRLLAEMPG